MTTQGFETSGVRLRPEAKAQCPMREAVRPRTLSTRLGKRRFGMIFQVACVHNLGQTSPTLTLCISVKYLTYDPFTETFSLV